MTSMLRHPLTVKGDVPTRWHSKLGMFQNLLQNCRALGKLASHFTDAILVAAQWDEVQELADFLNVEILSKEKDVMASLLLLLHSELKECLIASTEDSPMLRCMKRRMRNKFEHRSAVNERSVTAALLDPWFQNLTVVEAYFKNRMMSVEFLTGQVEKHVTSSGRGTDAAMAVPLACLLLFTQLLPCAKFTPYVLPVPPQTLYNCVKSHSIRRSRVRRHFFFCVATTFYFFFVCITVFCCIWTSS